MQTRVRVVIRTRAQQREGIAHLSERSPSGGGGLMYRLSGAGRVTLDGQRGAVGESNHHREVVRHDVVHLAGDAVALCGDGELREPFTILLSMPVSATTAPAAGLTRPAHPRHAPSVARTGHASRRRSTYSPRPSAAAT